MKLLIVSNDSTTYGSNRSMLNLIDELKRKNIEIKVLIPNKGDIEEELQKRKIEYKVEKYYSWITGKGCKKQIKQLIKMLLNNILIIQINKWVKKEKFDIIHSSNSAVYIGAIIAQRNKTPHVWHIRELMKEDHNLEFFNEKYTLKLFERASKLIYVSKCVKDKYSKLLNKNNGKLIYNGLPSKENINNEIPSLDNNIFKCLIAGNICETKGQKEAIEAINILVKKGIKNVKLYLAGEGRLENELKKYVEKNNLNKYIEFLGFRNDLDSIRKNVNIYLMCSKNEAFGRVTIEGMLSKNLIIGANTGGTVEIIRNNYSGILYKQGDAEDLAKKIEYAINNWEECKKIIENAYTEALNKFTIEICANSVYEIYKELLGEK